MKIPTQLSKMISNHGPKHQNFQLFHKAWYARQPGKSLS